MKSPTLPSILQVLSIDAGLRSEQCAGPSERRLIACSYLGDGVSGAADEAGRPPRTVESGREGEQSDGDERPGSVDEAGPGLAGACLGGEGRLRGAGLDGGRLGQAGLQVEIGSRQHDFGGVELELGVRSYPAADIEAGPRVQGGVPGVVYRQGESECVPGLLPAQVTMLEGFDSGACDVEVDAYPLALDDVQAHRGVTADDGGFALHRRALDDHAPRAVAHRRTGGPAA